MKKKIDLFALAARLRELFPDRATGASLYLQSSSGGGVSYVSVFLSRHDTELEVWSISTIGDSAEEALSQAMEALAAGKWDAPHSHQQEQANAPG